MPQHLLDSTHESVQFSGGKQKTPHFLFHGVSLPHELTERSGEV